MTSQHPSEIHKDPQRFTRKKGDRKQYEPEIIYQYWAAAGGNVRKAKYLAEDAGDDRVPSDDHTWAVYAEQHHFAERLKEDEEGRWHEFHAERERQQQYLLDEIAHTFEEVMYLFCKTLKKDIEALHSGDPKSAARAEKRLTKLFGSMDAVDRFYRMYFRARGLPERITQDTGKNSNPKAVGYDELEKEDNWAKSADEVRDESGKT